MRNVILVHGEGCHLLRHDLTDAEKCKTDLLFPNETLFCPKEIITFTVCPKCVSVSLWYLIFMFLFCRKVAQATERGEKVIRRRGIKQ